MSMRAAVLSGLLLFAAAAGIAAEPAPVVATRSMTMLNGVAATPGKAPFADGELLTHELYFRFLTVGTGTMSVDKGVSYDGQPAIHLSGAVSASAFGLTSMAGANDSWIDPTGLFSLGFVTDQDGPKVDDREEWRLDNTKAIATRDRVRKKGDAPETASHKEYALAKTHVQDVFSMLYFFRAFPVKVGDVLESDVYVSKKLWSLKFRVVKRENVKVPAGKFACLKVVPEITRDGEKAQSGQVTVWVTDDAQKIPVKIWTATKFGKLEAALLRK